MITSEDNEIDLLTERVLIEAIDFPEDAFYTIALHGPADFPGYRKTDPTPSPSLWKNIEGQAGAGSKLASPITAVEFVIFFNATRFFHLNCLAFSWTESAGISISFKRKKDHRGLRSYALNCFLPLSLRLFRTARPEAVCILLRKPCSILRWRFLG